MRRIWLALTLATFAAIPTVGVLAQTEPYSNGTVPQTTLVTPTVLGTTVTQEQLPKTGFESGWLMVGALVVILVGITVIWMTRDSGTDA